MVYNKEYLKILLVEDDEDDYIIIDDTLRMIQSFDIQLVWVANYAEAEKLIAEENYDLYLFDFYLGSKTGLDLLNHLYEHREGLPALLLTGQGNEDVISQALELGAYDYLEKSEIKPRTLERSIRYSLKHSSALQKLKKSEKLYRTVFEKSKEIIFIADDSYNLLSVSKSAERYTGYSRDELYTMMSSELFAKPIQISEMEDIFARNGNLSEYKVEIKTKEGKIKQGLISCELEPSDNNGFFLHGVFSDITEKIRADKMKLLNQKTMATSRLMRTLAHEVRNPLTNISLSIESLDDSKDEDVKIIADIILRNTKRIDNLITEVLNTAKAKEFELKDDFLSSVIEKAIQSVRDRAAIKNIDIEFTKPIEEKKTPVNKQQLKIAFSNILLNAIEALESTLNPKIKVDLNNDLEVKIEDNGIGMNEEQTSKLFEPFFTSKNNGVGLGLAATLSILQSHKANVEVESKEGVGTTFYINFHNSPN